MRNMINLDKHRMKRFLVRNDEKKIMSRWLLHFAVGTACNAWVMNGFDTFMIRISVTFLFHSVPWTKLHSKPCQTNTVKPCFRSKASSIFVNILLLWLHAADRKSFLLCHDDVNERPYIVKDPTNNNVMITIKTLRATNKCKFRTA